jgi:hypothetical protein
MVIIIRSSIWAASVASKRRHSWRHWWLSKLSQVSAPGAVVMIMRPGTRHLGRLSSAVVDAGLVAFFFERVRILVVGLESSSETEKRVFVVRRVRGGMRGENELKTPDGESKARADGSKRQKLSGKMQIFTAP